ncbi:aminopeptidase P family protein [Clostridium manihotivorum]|uniref:Peptidase M24 n=1 Tax=Clostridium manihotivorum TaxID=2320868 RepID=A0A3R5UIB1_9CLOT|nr:aminopeptidase P family protein [Clostridium manihotivorum]QAA34475.1 peptidase M24 [Clostridium manihotivorum]
MKVRERLEALRELMKEKGIDAYIIPSFDAHQSEYVAEHWKSRQWVSGFTGSAGTVVVTKEEAGLWTDGRYYIQAEEQLKDTGIKLFRAVDPGVPSYTDWLKDKLKEESVVGIDGSVFSVNMVKDMEKEFASKEISINMKEDLIGVLWTDRPDIPKNNIFDHEVQYAGKSRIEKLQEVRKEMRVKAADYYLLTSLDDIAWLLNIRGNDVANNPVVTAYVVVTMEEAQLFIDISKVPEAVKAILEADKVYVKDYDEVEKFLQQIKKEETIIFDPKKTNARLYKAIDNEVKKIEEDNITTKLKAIKNQVEMDNLRHCETKDGVAMVKFIKWLKESVGKEVITEVSASEKLESLRREQALCVGPSFDTIAGYKDHAAMMHYKATEESQYTLKNEGFFLVDSGGQYYDGTTDTTRTIVLGRLTEEERLDFTIVLKGHIALSTTKFLEGTTGSNLDILARQPIWNYGLDYKCGTGHGVGFFLNVHEGPQSISRVPNAVKLEKGMILTNEPGIYKEGKHGIRTENMMLVVEDEETEFGSFMKFEPITYCPIDLEGLNIELLTAEEKQWLNSYHKDVYNKLSPYLNEEEKGWLAGQTREI